MTPENALDRLREICRGRDFLGHVDVKTTQIYARANLEMKRNALEKISDASPVRTMPSWQHNKDLLDWLRSL